MSAIEVIPSRVAQVGRMGVRRAGELVHHDSLGSEQAIRPGQLNLMTAGHGIAHAEESPSGQRGQIHGMQLWVAQPSSTRDGPAAFEHHAEPAWPG